MKKKKSVTEELPEFRNDYLHLIIDEATGLMYSEWVRKPSGAEYRQAVGIFSKHLRQKKIRFWIEDANKLGHVPTEDLKALFEELAPVASASALEKMARVTTDDCNMETFRKLAEHAQAKMNCQIQVQQFTSYHQAVEWISE